jgi:hypothetical protein
MIVERETSEQRPAPSAGDIRWQARRNAPANLLSRTENKLIRTLAMQDDLYVT